MADRDRKQEQGEHLGMRPETALRGLLYVGYVFFLPWAYFNAGMSQAGLGIPGLERAFAFTSGTYYLFLGFSYIGAFFLLFILWFSHTLNRLVVGLVIIAPLGVTHLNRWYALQHFPEVWPM